MKALQLETVARLAKESARDYALRFLKHNIINFHLAPGSMVSAAELAEITGISRTPIREAMQELEKTGILEIFPQAGSRISYIDYDKIHESCFIRLTLEAAVVTLACDCMGPADEMAFEDIIQVQEKCVERGNTDNFLELDHQFHRQIYLTCDRAMTYQTLEGCLWHFDRLRRLSFNAVSIRRLVDEHRELFDVMRARDKKTAKKIVHRHLTRYLEDEKILREKYPDYMAGKNPS